MMMNEMLERLFDYVIKNVPDGFLKLSFGELATDDDATNANLSHVGLAAYDCLRSYYSEFHHSLWNVTKGKVVGELHQTPKEADPQVTDATN